MKRFQFRLDPVRRLRAFELERARALLAEVQAEIHRRETELGQARESLAFGRGLLEKDASEGADGHRLALHAQGVMLGQLFVERACRAVADLAPALEEAQLRVRRAHTRMKSLDRLREKRAEAHRLASLAQEQAALEELAAERLGHARLLGDQALNRIEGVN